MIVELGQVVFGNKWEELEAPDFMERDLYKLSRLLGELSPEHQIHGILGGAWGYGQDFENEVFVMFPYYWGDCTCGYDEKEWAWSESHQHADNCYQNIVDRELKERGAAACEITGRAKQSEYMSYGEWRKLENFVMERWCKHFGLPLSHGCAVHCTCDFKDEWSKFLEENDHAKGCPVVRPNFRYKPSDITVHWYKYIGRSMTVNRDVEWAEWRKIMDHCINSVRQAV